MFKACTSGNIDKASEEIDCFANMGLRTLAVGYKTINEDQLNSFLESLAGASTSIVNRAKYVREVYEELEQGLELLGATGIEDKLQDDVPETIYALKKAGVRIWMLTGDKKETAINAGHSAGKNQNVITKSHSIIPIINRRFLKLQLNIQFMQQEKKIFQVVN